MCKNKYLTRSIEDRLEISQEGYMYVLKHRKSSSRVYERVLRHFHFRINKKQKEIILGHLGAMLKRYDATLVYHCFIKRIGELKGVSIVPMLANIEYDSVRYVDDINKQLKDMGKYGSISTGGNSKSNVFNVNPFANEEYHNNNYKSIWKVGFGE